MDIKPSFGDEFGHLSSNFIRYYHIWAKQQGIHYNQLAVLHSLIRNQYCTQKHICDLWTLPKQTISSICKQYIDDGIITFAQTDDKREKQLSLTEKGKQFAAPIIARLDALEQQIFAEFGEARTQQLLQDFHDMAQIFARHIDE